MGTEVKTRAKAQSGIEGRASGATGLWYSRFGAGKARDDRRWNRRQGDWIV